MSYLGQKLPEGRIYVLFIIIASLSPGRVPWTKWVLNNFLLNWSSLKISHHPGWTENMKYFLPGCRPCSGLRELFEGGLACIPNSLHLLFPSTTDLSHCFFLFNPSCFSKDELSCLVFLTVSLFFFEYSLLCQGQEHVPGFDRASLWGFLWNAVLTSFCRAGCHLCGARKRWG